MVCTPVFIAYYNGLANTLNSWLYAYSSIDALP